ncbi:MAG: hypothetical protein JSU96_10645 [Acidobacteriota bacterium]|nr:MAG: hypothetical protein JSU96_10645 [Acidobacteriota bacterium]
MSGSATFSRRGFLIGATGAGAAVASTSSTYGTRPGTRIIEVHPSPEARLSVSGKRITVNTAMMEAILDSGRLTSLKNKSTGEQFIEGGSGTRNTLELVYPNRELAEVGESDLGECAVKQVSPLRAEVKYQSYKGDGVVSVEVCAVTGDLLVEPSAYSSRPGVRACRWNIPGIRPQLELVAPFFQGIKLPLSDSLIQDSHWTWPMSWEAGLAILQSQDSGFWIHTQDNRYRYKALQVGGKGGVNSIGLDTEAYGPLDSNLAAGGLTWRINVFQGGWEKPAEIYRQWLWKAYGLDEQEEKRKEWIKEVRMAISWCPGETAILDALARKVDPQAVLIHFPDWRTDAYDENYPTYQASPQAREFLTKGHKMGFRIMPHFNSIDMDPSHPVYERIRDFQYRTLEKKDIWGWSWFDGRPMGVPESNAARGKYRDKKVMVKVHPGLSIWRSILGDAMREAGRDLNLESAFIDVTLTTGNLHNCLVEGLTSSEGMDRLIRQVAALGDGLVIGGEGLNETTFQGQSFAQVHLFRSWQTSIEGLERAGGCTLNDLLFSRLCRAFGYSGLGGRNDAEILRSKIHREHNTIPTITIRSANEIENPNATVGAILKETAG